MGPVTPPMVIALLVSFGMDMQGVKGFVLSPQNKKLEFGQCFVQKMFKAAPFSLGCRDLQFPAFQGLQDYRWNSE